MRLPLNLPYRPKEPAALTALFGRTLVQTRSNVEEALQIHGKAEAARQLASPRLLLLVALILGVLTHGYFLFNYPLYITDEGIYMQQAWSLIVQRRLSPYTYFYDHAPGGWILIAAWETIMPLDFGTFGHAINSGRLLMLVIHVLSVFLLFQVTRRLSGSALAAFVATFFFNMSPLAIFYQRQVLLDNIMVLWVLLSLYLLTFATHRIVPLALSGIAFGIGVLTKENAIFFAPVFAFVLYMQTRSWPSFRFSTAFWGLASLISMSLYFLYAALKWELFPSDMNFDLSQPPSDHVSLLYTIWWQMNRNQGSIFDPNSPVWQFGLGAWLPKDAFVLIAGGIAAAVNLVVGLQDRKGKWPYLAASGLAASYAFYLARGSVMLEFYVVPLLPLLAMNLGMLAAMVLRRLPILAQSLAVVALFAVLISPAVGYVFVKDEFGRIVGHDLYKLDLTSLQEQQLRFVRDNIPPNANVIIDEEMWVDLHNRPPYYSRAHSHWKAASDPEVRDELFEADWRKIDYFVVSNKMRQAMELNNGNGQEDWLLEGMDNSQEIWRLERGDIQLQVLRVIK